MYDHECCILFFHHKDDATTVAHLDLLRRMNPAYPVVAVTCDDGNRPRGVPGAVPVPLTYERGHNWQNADLIFYEWFRGPHRIEAGRYIWFEWDVYATAPVHDWYAEVWDVDAAASGVPRVERDYQRWPWFVMQHAFLPRPWQPHAAGVVPLNGLFLSHRALSALAYEPRHEGVFCELRLATLLRFKGFALTEMPPHKARCNQYLPGGKSIQVEDRPGIYHPVK